MHFSDCLSRCFPDQIRETEKAKFMDPDLAEATHKILAKYEDGAFANLPDPDYLFFHCLVNYAIAKKESAGIMENLQSLAVDRKHPDSRRF